MVVTEGASRRVPRSMQKVSIMKPVMQTWSPITRSAVVWLERRRRRACWRAFIVVVQ